MTLWSCNHCTLINNAGTPLCGACGSENPERLATKDRRSILPRVISKPINDLTNAMVDIFTVPKELPGNVISKPEGSSSKYQSCSKSPFPKRPPPPRPPPPAVVHHLTPESSRAMISSSSDSNLDYSVNWMCRTCYNINDLPQPECSQCGQTKFIGSKRHGRSRNGLLAHARSLQGMNNMTNDDFNSSLCSEITAEVERRDATTASVTFESIMNFCRTNSTSFIDDSFPHSAKSIGTLQSSDTTVGAVPREFAWLRPHNMFTKDGRQWNWCVFRDPRPSDIEQGVLGDCWLLSAMALIAERPDILEHTILTKQYNSSGVYQVRICVDGEWRVILVDDFFPCRVNSKSLAFATGRKNQLWVPLIEKAMAKHMGSYAKLSGGRTIEGLSMLTGAPCQQISLETFVEDGQKDILWAQLLSAREASFIMGCSCGSGKREVNHEVFKRKGLLTRHAYSILDVRHELHHRLIRLRNPWGTFVWQGAWSDNWKGWDKNLKSLLCSGEPESGSFWMSFDDFTAHFDSVDIAKIRAFSGWAELRVPVKMGGVFEEWDRAVRVLTEQPTELCFTLFQTGSRKLLDRVDLLICVHRVSSTGQVGELITRSSRTNEGSTSTGDIFLSMGQYVVVCHSLSTLGARKIAGCLAIHSSRPVFGDTIVCSADMYTDSLVQMTLAHGKSHTSLPGVIPRYITDDFGGLLLMIDNTLEDMWLHVKTECSQSTNVLSSRGALDVSDVIPPLSRQIIIILTHFEATNSYMLQHKLSVRLSSRRSLGTDYGADANSSHSPPFSSITIQRQHGIKSLFI